MTQGMQRALLVEVLRDPAHVHTLGLDGWELLLRQALAAGLHGALPFILEEAGLLDAVPPAPRAHLDWHRTVALRHADSVRAEARHIARALGDLKQPLILLKGAAYVMAGLPMSHGRLFSDVDILVPKASLNAVESALLLNGWEATHHDAYDQRYYREWMHELPPLEHVRRGTAIDVHHAILPETAPRRPDPASLRAAAVPIPWPAGLEGDCALAVLAPQDMVLHSAVHLFWDGEFDHGLRDLFDLHRLLLHFGGRDGFWDTLVPRARALELDRPLFYALRHAARVFGTPVPPAVTAQAAAAAPNPALLALMDALLRRGLAPRHASCADALSGSAAFLLYIRGNWLRMPPLLLARHLFHKAFLSPREHIEPAAPV